MDVSSSLQIIPVSFNQVKGLGQMRTFDLRLQPGSTKLVQVRGLRRLGLGLGLGLGFEVMVMVMVGGEG
jgi:hypothetical protein